MNIWKCKDWKSYYSNRNIRRGIRLDFDKEVNEDVKRAIKNLIGWLRKEYEFPVRVRIYVKKQALVRARDGDMVPDLFFWPYNRDEEPYIKIATGDYYDLLKQMEKDDALATILMALLQELTHYFQWLNGLDFSEDSLMAGARKSADRIMDIYSETREHP